MSIGQSLLPEFDAEMASTRKALERVPEDKLDWKCHEKSNTIGWVASHLVEIPGWVKPTLDNDEFDINPKDGEPYQTQMLTSVAEILELFDKNVAEAREALAGATDEMFAAPWSLTSGGEVMMTMPTGVCIRTWVLNHSIHHRAHLLVYLRLNDIPVPGVYGPSADEGPAM